MGFDFPHGLAVINLFTAGWTFVKLQPWDRIGLPLKLASPFLSNLLNLVASTSGAFGDREHNVALSGGLLGGNQEVVSL
jgi:hypothetical protein